MKLSCVIPTLTRADLLAECLPPLVKHRSLLSSFYVIDNGHQGLDLREHGITLIEPPRNLGVSRSWNLGLRLALKCDQADWVLVVDDDIIFRDQAVPAIRRLLQSATGMFMFIGRKFCWFAISKEAASIVEYRPGKYCDEQFSPAWYEDIDLYWRLEVVDPSKVRDLQRWQIATLRVGSTSGNMPQIRSIKNRSRRRFRRKWGCLGPDSDRWRVPYTAPGTNAPKRCAHIGPAVGTVLAGGQAAVEYLCVRRGSCTANDCRACPDKQE